MPLAPELSTLPQMTASFYRAGLVGELIRGMIQGETDRNLVADAQKLSRELRKNVDVQISGLEHIPVATGCLIVFNHPNMDVLLPAMLELMIGVSKENVQRVRLAMGSEIPMTTRHFNEKSAVPGSVWLLERFHGLYSKNIISVPTAETRKDFLMGRAVAVRKIMRSFEEKAIVFISPEGHVEADGAISPLDTYHEGSGKLAMFATRMNIPTVPVGVWVDETKRIHASVGKPFFVSAPTPKLASVELMREVANSMPVRLRGPFT